MDWKNRRFTWDEKHMMAALGAASRCSCLYFHAGAVLVKNKRIIAEGYNGAGEKIKNCLERGCRKEEHGINFETKGTGNCRGVHAEWNALEEIAKKDAQDSTLYTTHYPCSTCAKLIANKGVIKVVYLKTYKEPTSLTQETFEEREVEVQKLDLDIERCLNVLRETYSF